MTDNIDLHGALNDGFGPLADAFRQSFADGSEIGAACAVYRAGAPVASLYAGHVSRRGDALWAPETMPSVYSTMKAVVALLVAMAVDEGAIEYDAPVASYWPEFGANGKGDITVAEALSHQGGLSGFADETPRDIWLDWDAASARIAAMAPLFPPRSASGYHPQTYGFIAGEILKRTTGKSVGETLRGLFEDPQDAVIVGLREAEFDTLADMTKPPRPPDLGALNPYKEAAFLKPWSASGRAGDAAWRMAEIPASNGHATARGLARLMHAFVDGQIAEGPRVLSPATLAAATKERIAGDDLVLPFRLSWGAGLIRNSETPLYGPTPSAVGHSGFGGSCTFADAEAGVSFAYVTNKMSEHLIADPRALRLIDALYECL